MKIFLKKLLVCIMIFIVLFNFVFENPVHAFDATDVLGGILEVVGTLADGIAGILTYPFKILALVLETCIMGIIGAVASTFGYVDANGIVQTSSDIGLFTPDDIFFNKILLTDINIFNTDLGDDDKYDTIEKMRCNIALWYYVMRVIAISILLGILIYIAIRMSISTLASDKAHYKKMLANWVWSIALVFLLHLLIVGFCNLNSVLVNMFSKIYEDSDALENSIGTLLGQTMAVSFTSSWSAIVVSAMIIMQTLAFLIYYIKRMITLSFLVIISPLITITYSIDKLGDGKAQALGAWMKEFFFTIIIQPFHCVIYMVFMSMAMSALGIGGEDSFSLFGSFGVDSLVGGILAILCIKFVWDAEKIIKNIFGIKVSESLGDAVASAAVAGAVVSKGVGMASKAGGAVKGITKIGQKYGGSMGGVLKDAGNKIASSRVGQFAGKVGKSVKDSKVGQTVGNIGKGIGNAASTATKPIRKLGEKVNDKLKVTERAGQVRDFAKRNITGFKNYLNENPNGQFLKRYLTSAPAVAAAVMGSAMTYGASPKTSLFEAGLAGYGTYKGVNAGIQGLMNRKNNNYLDNVDKTDKVLCDIRGEDASTRTESDKANDRITATVRDEQGDFKNIKDMRKDARKSIISALQDKDREAGLSEEDIKDKSDNYEKIADKAMNAIDNGVYTNDLNCNEIAKEANLDPSVFRGAVGEYAEARVCKKMATENEQIDTLAGQEGYFATVLKAYADNPELETSTESSTETSTHTESETETTNEQQNSTQGDNNPSTTPQPKSSDDIANDIVDKLKQYLQDNGNQNADLDQIHSYLQNNNIPEDQWSEKLSSLNDIVAPVINLNDGPVLINETYFEDAIANGKTNNEIVEEICINEQIDETEKEIVRKRVEELRQIFEVRNIIREISNDENTGK